jgi:hypothetical protein
MINVYDLTNATVVTLFGMFALWAAGSRRHWFVRTAVVAGAILITLLIPAYELVILLCVQTLVVVAGMAIWRRRRRRKLPTAEIPSASSSRRFRLSMETLMLAVVIVAVATAVVARVPALDGGRVYEFVIDGLMAAEIALASVWIVCGSARWWLRELAFPLLVVLFAAQVVALHWAGYIVRYAVLTPNRSLTEYLNLAYRDIGPSTLSWSKPVALGMVAICLWIYCARRAGWFDPFREQASLEAASSLSPKTRVIANTFAAIMFCIMAIFPLVLLYKLLNPTPIPTDPLPNPNGFDDLVAAGNMIGPTSALTLQDPSRLTAAQLDAELAKHRAAFELMQRGLQRPSRNAYVFKPWPAENARSLIHLFEAFRGQIVQANRNKELERELDLHLTLLRLAQEEGRGSGVSYFGGMFNQYEKDGYTGIWDCVSRLSAAQCIDLVAKLRDIEARREPWSEREVTQRAIEDNSDWEIHLSRILSDWYGHNRHQWQRIEEYRRIGQLRMLIVKLAIRAFELENDRLPETLDELVPKYMPEIPIDPFGGGPLKYRRTGVKYILYSCGPDEDDDGGQPRAVLDNEEVGDMTDEALFVQPVFQPSVGPP